ncbi:MAG: MFS transporter [Proteobacteria bacterium]|nr:MFS transporter [Pseudomonadota bacterium]
MTDTAPDLQRQPPPPELRLSQATIWAYCLPAIGFGGMGMLVGIYLMKFSTDVLLIAPAAMGVIYGVGRIWDAISDPIAGFLSDRSTARRGRRRSWMLASVIPIAVATVMLWTPPTVLEGVLLILWMGVALLLFETAMTIFFVPYGALGMELTSHYHERTRLFGYRHVIAAAGSGFGLGGVYLLRTAQDPRTMAFAVSLVGGAVMAALILFAALKLPERSEYQGRGAVNITKAFTDVFRNEHGRLLLIVYGIETFGVASIGMLAPYIMQYVIKAPELTEAFILVYFIPQFALTPMWIRLSRRFGKKQLWVFSMAVLTVGYSGLFFISEGSYVLIFSIIFVLGLGGGCGAVVAPAIQADVIDYDEFLTGERKEGAYLAIFNLVRKGAGGITAIATGFVLQAVGFVPNAEQSESTLTAMVALIGILPGACYLIGTLLFLRFRLNEKEHAEVMAVLKARALGTPSESSPVP